MNPELYSVEGSGANHYPRAPAIFRGVKTVYRTLSSVTAEPIHFMMSVIPKLKTII